MNLLKPCKANYRPPFWSSHLNFQKIAKTLTNNIAPSKVTKIHVRKLKVAVVRACNNGGRGEKKTEERRSFLSLEEAGMVEMSGLISHEKFLCRLTISSLNLLRVIAEQEGCSIEELNAGRVCDWFLKDKLKREQNLDSAVLQWDESNFQL